MEVLCGLRPVDLVKDKRIRIVLSNRQVKRLNTRFCPHQRQIFADGLDKLRTAQRLKTPTRTMVLPAGNGTESF